MAGEEKTADMQNDAISAADHLRITAAIREAETRTSGEIFAVVAHTSDDYTYVAGFFAAFWALMLGLATAIGLWWAAVPVSPLPFAASQVAGFAVVAAFLAAFPRLRMWAVPRTLAYRRASANAVRQFLAHNIHTTSERSGVLLFVSLAERYAEVVADEGINSHVAQGEWDAMVAELVESARSGRLADGFITAIERSGALLAVHFPPEPEGRNELDDRLVEL